MHRRVFAAPQTIHGRPSARPQREPRTAGPAWVTAMAKETVTWEFESFDDGEARLIGHICGEVGVRLCDRGGGVWRLFGREGEPHNEQFVPVTENSNLRLLMVRGEQICQRLWEVVAA